MKRISMIAVLAALVLLTGCKRSEETQPASEVGDITASAEVTEASAAEEETASETETTAPAETETAAQTEVSADTEPQSGYQGIKQPDSPSPERPTGMIYREALENLRDHLIFPDGTTANLMGNMEENKFAVYDIDGDGRDELIIRFTASAMAGMIELVYDVNDMAILTEELVAFPNVTYYDNGLVTVGISHNQGYAGNFWPYSVYEYNSEDDVWNMIAFVDAMDRAVMREAGVEDEYPEDADTSGSGFVYFIGSDDPVDVTEYNTWHNALFGNAKEIEIPFLSIDEENVEALK